MKRVTGAKVAVAAMTALVVVYLVFTLQLAWQMLATGSPIAQAMGAALVIFPIAAFWLVGREIQFGMQSERLLADLAARGELPPDDLPRRPSGRVVREAADADFTRWKHGVEADPSSAAAWARLALAYGASGDRRRSRAAMRRAIRLGRGGDVTGGGD